MFYSNVSLIVWVEKYEERRATPPAMGLTGKEATPPYRDYHI